MTADELADTRRAFVKPPQAANRPLFTVPKSASPNELPIRWDWRERGAVSSIKDQVSVLFHRCLNLTRYATQRTTGPVRFVAALRRDNRCRGLLRDPQPPQSVQLRDAAARRLRARRPELRLQRRLVGSPLQLARRQQQLHQRGSLLHCEVLLT